MNLIECQVKHIESSQATEDLIHGTAMTVDVTVRMDVTDLVRCSIGNRIRILTVEGHGKLSSEGKLD